MKYVCTDPVKTTIADESTNAVATADTVLQAPGPTDVKTQRGCPLAL